MLSSARSRIAAAPPWPAILRRLARTAAERIVAAGRAVQRSRRQRAIHFALLQLDERTLRDLGLRRCELRSLVHGPDVMRWLDR